MTTVLLDATELRKDWLCIGLKYQLIQHMDADWISVRIPASVFEEHVANHAREVSQLQIQHKKLVVAMNKLGVHMSATAESNFDLREYLDHRFDEILGFTVLPWPTETHEQLVQRAITRRPPFDQKGGGYRDALVWADALALAREGQHVVLVSADKAFQGAEGDLAAELQQEIDGLAGTVELITDFTEWLLAQLPWEVSSLESAVAASRDDQFYKWFIESDFQGSVWPEVTDLGLLDPPYRVAIDEVDWDGTFNTLEVRTGPHGATVAEYELGQVVRFDAAFRCGAHVDDEWSVREDELPGRIEVSGEIRLVVRVVVLFDEDGMAVDEVKWLHPANMSPGARLYEDDPGQLGLFDGST